MGKETGFLELDRRDRDYLDPAFRDDFDEWRGGYSNPAKKHIGGKKAKNWDAELRRGDLLGDGLAVDLLQGLVDRYGADGDR